MKNGKIARPYMQQYDERMKSRPGSVRGSLVI